MLVNNNTLLNIKDVSSIIHIRSNIPLPTPMKSYQLSKYGFISTLKIGQSFEINGDTPNYQAKSLAPAAYAVASYIRKTTHLKRDKGFTVACRTLEGTCKEPVVVGCWRIS
jgi:hypothetical protein